MRIGGEDRIGQDIEPRIAKALGRCIPGLDRFGHARRKDVIGKKAPANNDRTGGTGDKDLATGWHGESPIRYIAIK